MHDSHQIVCLFERARHPAHNRHSTAPMASHASAISQPDAAACCLAHCRVWVVLCCADCPSTACSVHWHTLLPVLQVWKFESDSTLADALSGNLGQWPEDIEEIMLKKVDETQPVEKREAAVSDNDKRGTLGLSTWTLSPCGVD